MAQREFSAFWTASDTHDQWPGNTHGYMHRYMIEQDLPPHACP